MPIWEPRLHAECDRCEAVTDPIDMTALAGGGWDDRNVKAQLKRLGWYINGEQTICPECVEIGARS